MEEEERRSQAPVVVVVERGREAQVVVEGVGMVGVGQVVQGMVVVVGMEMVVVG
jgi:hypothetical protein